MISYFFANVENGHTGVDQACAIKILFSKDRRGLKNAYFLENLHKPLFYYFFLDFRTLLDDNLFMTLMWWTFSQHFYNFHIFSLLCHC